MLPAVLIVVLGAAPAGALTLKTDDIGVSKRIPSRGETIRWLIPVANNRTEAWEGEVALFVRAGRSGEPLRPALEVHAALRLEPGQVADVPVDWTPAENGYWRLRFELAGTDQRALTTIAVTETPVYFVWFGAPKRFRWCNVPTTVREEDAEWWLRRGAIPAHWKCGVCCRHMSVDEFVQNWASADWIAIDEVGGPGEDTDKFIAAWRKLKERKPHQWIGVWMMGAHHYWGEVSDLIDLFLPETYLNYFGNHLGCFDSYFRIAREAGVIHKTVPCLGINEIKDASGRITVSPTRGDVERQLRYIKRTAPDVPGVGFFTSDSAGPGVAEFADARCEDYFIKPVLTVLDLADPITLSGAPADARRVATVRVRNVGNMDARNVGVEWCWGKPKQGSLLVRETVAHWPAGEERRLELPVSCELGCTLLQFRIVPSPTYTVLDGHVRTWVVRPPAELSDAPVLVVPPTEASYGPLPFPVVVEDWGPFAVSEMDSGLKRRTDLVAVRVPSRPGLEERLAVVVAEPYHDRPRPLLLEKRQRPVPAPSYTREGSSLIVEHERYRAVLDLSTDRILFLAPAGGTDNLLTDPWECAVPVAATYGNPQVTELPGALVVTIPWRGEQADGESQYLFLSQTPAIRIARSFAPKGEVTVRYSGERCGLAQQGGTYALQAGVGGPVDRGWLQDGDQYRDLLFGYLGEAPGPHGFDRAGWLDFSYDGSRREGGLGVAIEYRWEDAYSSVGYDVTRLYDASDWIEVLNVWGGEKRVSRPQRSCVWLLPHPSLDLSDEAVTPPILPLWRLLHAQQLAAAGEGDAAEPFSWPGVER